MPVEKRRDIEGLERPAAQPTPGANVREALELSELSERLRPRAFPSGVWRYRSMEEASEHKRSWERSG